MQNSGIAVFKANRHLNLASFCNHSVVLKIMTVQRNVFREVANLCGRNRKMSLDYSITDVQWEPAGGKNKTFNVPSDLLMQHNAIFAATIE